MGFSVLTEKRENVLGGSPTTGKKGGRRKERGGEGAFPNPLFLIPAPPGKKERGEEKKGP